MKFGCLWLKQAFTALFLSSPAFDIAYTKTKNSIKYDLWKKTINYMNGVVAGIQTCMGDKEEKGTEEKDKKTEKYYFYF